MIIADLSTMEGRTYPARRRTQNLAGGPSPIQTQSFSVGYVTLEPNGGQVPWHNQEQEEVYFVMAGTLPEAGVDVPPLPEGAWPQCTDKPQ